MKTVLSALALLAAAGLAPAQQHVQANVVKIPHAAMVAAPAAGAQMQLEYIVAELGGKVVKGAPYSAEEITETKQVLADGNRIIRKRSAMVYRDGQGRTRREQTLGAVGPLSANARESGQSVVINDPVAGVNYVLDPVNRTARKLPAAGVFERQEVMSLKLPVVDATSHAPGGDRAEANLAFERQVVIAHKQPAAAQASVEGASGAGIKVMISHVDAGNVNRESLGKQVIEGVEAEGTRVTVTIPAGAIGNELPIQTVSETWYSPRLQTVVMSTQSDPRTGETTFRLTNASPGEPSPTLFQLPGDYKVLDAPGNVIWKSEDAR